jgi:2-keto-4-pentenoate hydratase
MSATASGFDAQKAAIWLRDARTRRERLQSLPAGLAPRTVEEGVAAQQALAGLGGNARPAGFKIGATAKRMQEYLGLAGPAAGFMAASGMHANGAVLRFADFTQPGVECEIVVKLAKDLPPGPCTAEQAAACVGEFTAGIEIVENRYGDIAALGTPTLIADQVFHAACICGQPGGRDWQSLDIPELVGRMAVDGVVKMEGKAGDLLGHPMNCLAWLAASPVAAAFGGLKAGQVIMLGSVTPPIWLEAPCRVTVDFSPLPTVQVQFT